MRLTPVSDIDLPGGRVTDVFQLAKLIRIVNISKPDGELIWCMDLSYLGAPNLGRTLGGIVWRGEHALWHFIAPLRGRGGPACSTRA